jgi:hypothetical protein
MPRCKHKEETTIDAVIEDYAEKYDLLNVYVFGSSLFVQPTTTVPPKDLDVILVVKDITYR